MICKLQTVSELTKRLNLADEVPDSFKHIFLIQMPLERINANYSKYYFALHNYKNSDNSIEILYHADLDEVADQIFEGVKGF